MCLKQGLVGISRNQFVRNIATCMTWEVCVSEAGICCLTLVGNPVAWDGLKAGERVKIMLLDPCCVSHSLL